MQYFKSITTQTRFALVFKVSFFPQFEIVASTLRKKKKIFVLPFLSNGLFKQIIILLYLLFKKKKNILPRFTAAYATQAEVYKKEKKTLIQNTFSFLTVSLVQKNIHISSLKKPLSRKSIRVRFHLFHFFHCFKMLYIADENTIHFN